MFKLFIKKLSYFFPSSIKYFVRDIFLYFYSTINGAVNIKKIDFVKKYEGAVVLGNGPSLNIDRQEIQSWVGKKDFVCVNNFCDDELYTILKPSLYVFLDPYFFSDDAHDSWVVRREKTFTILNETTDWKMNIVVPFSANLNIIKDIVKNKNIKIFKVNTQSMFSTRFTLFQKWLFDKGIYGPPQVNVLIYGLYLSVISDYKNIVFYGADLSFHNDVKVDQENNNLYIEYKHFNEENKIEPLMRNPDKIKPLRMAELMKLTADTFYAHEVINEYAVRKGIIIENASSYSLIDAYPRSEKVRF